MYLSENLNADAVEATYTNGVLEVRIPVLEQAKPRKVEVRQADDQKELVG
jgi:HSP20 family protein